MTLLPQAIGQTRLVLAQPVVVRNADVVDVLLFLCLIENNL